MKYQVHYPYLTLIINSPISIEDLFQSFHLSKKTIHLLKQNKDYTVNKRFVSPSTILIKGDQLTIKAFQQDDGMYPPNYQPIDIVYEDEFILVVNKPAFLNVFPDSKEHTHSLSNMVSGYYHQCGYDLPVRFIHRLDLETTGLVMFCKCAFIQPLLDYQLSIKAIQRHYLAIVEGKVTDHHIHHIDKPIGRDRHHHQRMIISKNGKSACTHYQCLANKKNLSLLKCQLDTGRKHQIRVHLSSIGLPILGDKLYHHPSSLIDHQALHAYKLEFVHPITQEKMTITGHPPYQMKQIIHSIDPTL
ncbi:MAG: RluA family pseudouridine synthase [Longibaculum sp.]